MGKRKGRKRKNRSYNQKDFVGIFCPQCDFCPEGSKPIFCYQELYRYEPRRFVSDVFQNILDACATFRRSGVPLNSLTIEQFKKIVCETGVCHGGDGNKAKSCANHKGCYLDFREQMGQSRIIVHSLHSDAEHRPKISRTGTNATKSQKKKKSKKKKQARYIVEAYPTYFSSDKNGFKEKVKYILNGNNPDKHDKHKEADGEFRRKSDEPAEGRESKVR